MLLRANGWLIIMLDNMNIKLYSKFPQPEESFLQLMKKTSKLFTPPISEVADLESYSHKLYTHASFVVCCAVDGVRAFTAFYKNMEAKQVYISLICVEKKLQSQGIGTEMLAMLSNLSVEGFTSIGLEVVKANVGAYQFYKKHGFKEQEDRGEKFLMIKYI